MFLRTLARASRALVSLASLAPCDAPTSLPQQPQTHPDRPTTGAGVSGLCSNRSVRAERYRRAAAVFAAVRRQHRRHCALSLSNAPLRGRLAYGSPPASLRPALPPSPPPHARGGSRSAPSGREARCRAPGHGLSGGVCCAYPRSCVHALVLVLHGSPVSPSWAVWLSGLSPASRGCACRAPAPSPGRALCPPAGEGGCRFAPFFVGYRLVLRPPATRVSRSPCRARVCPAPRSFDGPQIPDLIFAGGLQPPAPCLYGRKNAPSPAHHPLNYDK